MYTLVLIGLMVSPGVIQSSRIRRGAKDLEKFDGPCPSSDVDTIQAFDQRKMEGLWYVVQSYKGGFHMDCVNVNYSWNSTTRTFHEIVKEARIPLSWSTTSAILHEKQKFSNEGKFFDGDMDLHHYYFVAIDENNDYAVLWYCQDHDKASNIQNLVVLARDWNFDINSSKSLNRTLAKKPFDVSRLKHINHDEIPCHYNSSKNGGDGHNEESYNRGDSDGSKAITLSIAAIFLSMMTASFKMCLY